VLRAFGESHDAFRREATEMFAKWEERRSGNRSCARREHQPLHERRRLATGAPRTIIPAPPTRAPWTTSALSPPTRHRRDGGDRDARRGDPPRSHAAESPFTVRFASHPDQLTSPTRPEFGWLLRLLEQHGDAEPVASPPLAGPLPAMGVHGHARHPGAVDPGRQQRQPANTTSTNTTCGATSSSRPRSTRRGRSSRRRRAQLRLGLAGHWGESRTPPGEDGRQRTTRRSAA